MKTYEVKDHAPSLLPEGEWKLVWSDEFDGTALDTSKWGYRLEMMGKRHRAWDTEGVKLDGNSHAVFTLYEKDGEVCSSQLQTGCNYMDAVPSTANPCGNIVWPLGDFGEQRFTHKYGYYECRCRLQKREGWWSAFWLQSPTIGTSPIPEEVGVENDIMESFHAGKILFHANHYNGYGNDHKMEKAGEGMEISTDEFHTFGLLWDEKDGYTFYVDGKEDGHIAGPISHREQFILISTEVNGYRYRSAAATEEAHEAARLGDVADGKDIAEAAYYFVCHARNTTGAELVVDGGNTIQLYPIVH